MGKRTAGAKVPVFVDESGKPFEFQDPAAADAEARLRGTHAIDWDHPISNNELTDDVVTFCGWRSSYPHVYGFADGKPVPTCQQCIDALKAQAIRG